MVDVTTEAALRMRRQDGSWIAFIPLYAVTIGQGFAVASWAALPILL